MGIRILFLVLVILVSGSTMILADNFLIIHTDDGETRVNLAEIDRITFASMEQEERDFPLTDDMSKTMVWIPSGEFDMGSPDNEEGRANNEGPVHRVLLEYRFWMGKFEITQAQWEAVTGDNPSDFRGEDRPVETVSWDGIHSFLDNIDQDFRLPSEAEWEYACRAGTQTRFYWGDDQDLNRIRDYTWSRENSNGQTYTVGEKSPNAWGLYDMVGNVYEFCEDVHHDNFDRAPNDGSAWIEGGGNLIVLHGGSWAGEFRECRSAMRDRLETNRATRDRGFRLVRDAD